MLFLYIVYILFLSTIRRTNSIDNDNLENKRSRIIYKTCLKYDFIATEAANKSSAVAEMGDCLATIDMGRKVAGACCAPFRGGAGSPTQSLLGQGLPPYTKWHLDPFNRLATVYQSFRQTDKDKGPVA